MRGAIEVRLPRTGLWYRLLRAGRVQPASKAEERQALLRDLAGLPDHLKSDIGYFDL